MRTIIIAGGGAAGMMAALIASEHPDRRIVLLERQERVGRKLLSTGNGRCNLSNRNASVERYFGENPEFAAPALRAFGPEKTISFFRKLGLLTRIEPDGKVYPYSNQAGSVLDVLRFALETRDNIQLHTGCAVSKASRTGTGFSVETAEQVFRGERLIIAAGGAASPDLGGSEDGYRLLEAFGHTRTFLFPALVQIKTDNTYPRALKGIKTNARVSLSSGNSVLAQSTGEILFTEYGVSGIAVFEISRHVCKQERPLTLSLDLMPEWEEREILLLLRERRAELEMLPAEQFLTGVLNKRLGQMLLKYCGISFSLPIARLEEEQIETIAKAMKSFSLPVTGTTGLQNAQVTAGGIETKQFDPETMESRLCPGLFSAGEVLDIDGACGGYNLQWAWSSGYLAGRSAAL